MFCKNCGNQIDDNAVVCPHCGVPVDNRQSTQQTQPVNTAAQPAATNTIAIVGFVLSFFVPIAGLICSIIGLRKAPECGGSGKGLSIAGIIISALWMLFSFCYAFIFFILLMMGM